MTISLTWQDHLNLYQEADKKELNLDVSDELDKTFIQTGRYFQGLRRLISLRKGIWLCIEETQIKERLLLKFPQFGEALRFNFVLSGKMSRAYRPVLKEKLVSLSTGRHHLSGSGLHDHTLEDCPETEEMLEVTLHIRPEVLRSFVGNPSGELPKVFQHLVGSIDSQCYMRGGETPAMVTTLLQQIIQCPYKGLTKRIYLESKVTEIMALMLEEEAAVQQGEFKSSLLQPDRLDRIHHAKEILLKNLSSPPSLIALSRQVGICDYSLERGFKEIFGTTVFGYLRDHRLEKAQQLLLDRQMKVAAVARAVGYDSPTSFNAAFKRKYGVSPKAYQLSMRK
ncbi:MAG: AraC family transcriptional regulator [Cyanobacteria bacterium P01_H01_bin.152]